MDDSGISATIEAVWVDDQDVQTQIREQIERLLGFPGVNALGADAIAINLAVPSEVLEPVLEALVEEGCVVRAEDGRFALPAQRRQL